MDEGFVWGTAVVVGGGGVLAGNVWTYILSSGIKPEKKPQP